MPVLSLVSLFDQTYVTASGLDFLFPCLHGRFGELSSSNCTLFSHGILSIWS